MGTGAESKVRIYNSRGKKFSQSLVAWYNWSINDGVNNRPMLNIKKHGTKIQKPIPYNHKQEVKKAVSILPYIFL